MAKNIYHSKNKTKLQSQIFNRLKADSHLVTHAVTLTYDENKIYRFLKSFRDGSTPKSEHMLERYVVGMKRFSNLLDRKLFGHSSTRHGTQRLYFVPVIEGFNKGKFPHWHCALGIPEDRRSTIEDVIKKGWKKVYFGGYASVEPVYSSKGWLDYISKCAKYTDRHNVCWEAMRTPIAADLD